MKASRCKTLILVVSLALIAIAVSLFPNSRDRQHSPEKELVAETDTCRIERLRDAEVVYNRLTGGQTWAFKYYRIPINYRLRLYYYRGVPGIENAELKHESFGTVCLQDYWTSRSITQEVAQPSDGDSPLEGLLLIALPNGLDLESGDVQLHFSISNGGLGSYRTSVVAKMNEILPPKSSPVNEIGQTRDQMEIVTLNGRTELAAGETATLLMESLSTGEGESRTGLMVELSVQPRTHDDLNSSDFWNQEVK